MTGDTNTDLNKEALTSRCNNLEKRLMSVVRTLMQNINDLHPISGQLLIALDSSVNQIHALEVSLNTKEKTLEKELNLI